MNGYTLLLVSAVGERDGMALELAAESGGQVAEVFEDDQTKQRAITFFTAEPLPVPVVEWLLADAARRL